MIEYFFNMIEYSYIINFSIFVLFFLDNFDNSTNGKAKDNGIKRMLLLNFFIVKLVSKLELFVNHKTTSQIRRWLK